MTDIANTESFDAWNGDSGQRWAREADRRDEVLASSGRALLEAAGLVADNDVLDLGCGCGYTTLAAARTIAPHGYALGLDLSAPMLDIARQRRDREGLVNVEFVLGDAQIYQFEPRFDVVISRFGTMFFADVVAAFTNIGRALRPRGRLCLATWQPFVANDWLRIPVAALGRYGTVAESVASGSPMFGQSEPERVITTLQESGFREVELTPVSVTQSLGANVHEATDYLASTGVARAILDTVAPEQRETAIGAVRAALNERADGGVVSLNGAIWIIAAERAPG